MLNDQKIIVGIIGKFNTGKNTVAKVFQHSNFFLMAFADPLKDIVQRLFGFSELELWGPSEYRTPEIRQILQELGTDYARKFRPNIWVDKMAQELDTIRASIIIPDVRFPNEAEMLHQRGAYLIRLTRSNQGDNATVSANAHRSETELEKIPDSLIFRSLDNSGTLEELQEASRILLKDIYNDATRK